MIKLSGSTDQMYTHAFYCDHCAAPIADAKNAVVLHRRATSVHEEYVDMAHVHKGECLKAAEARWGGPLKTDWSEMIDHVRYLIHNVGLTPVALQERDNVMEQPIVTIIDW